MTSDLSSEFDGAWIIGRKDNKPIDGDTISWYQGGNGNEPDWEQVNNFDHDEPVTYIAVRVAVTTTRTRTYGPTRWIGPLKPSIFGTIEERENQ
jgi:hypothetical protein